MNNIIPKTEWIKTWSENGVGWIQLNHENNLNPLSASFILAIKAAAEKFDNEPIKHPNGVLTALTMTTLFCICLFFKVNKI